MSVCGVRWCGNNSRISSNKKDGITFHRFPKSPELKSEWIDATRREESWFPSNNSVICSVHFTPDNFHALNNQRRRLMSTAVPTLYLPVLAPTSQEMDVDHNATVFEPSISIKCGDMDLSLSTTANTRKLVHDSASKGNNLPQTPIGKRKSSPNRDSPSAYDCPVKKRFCRKIIELQNTIKEKNVKLRKFRDANRRLKRQINSLRSVLDELEKEESIAQEPSLTCDPLGVRCREIIETKRKRLKTQENKY